MNVVWENKQNAMLGDKMLACNAIALFSDKTVGYKGFDIPTLLVMITSFGAKNVHPKINPQNFFKGENTNKVCRC